MGNLLNGYNAETLRQLQRAINRPKNDIGGRPPVFEDSEYGLNCFITRSEDYLEQLKNLVIKGSINKWCDYMNLTRPTLSTYRKRGKKWEHAIDYIKDKLQEENKIITQALNGNIPLRFLDQLNYIELHEEIENDYFYKYESEENQQEEYY